MEIWRRCRLTYSFLMELTTARVKGEEEAGNDKDIVEYLRIAARNRVCIDSRGRMTFLQG